MTEEEFGRLSANVDTLVTQGKQFQKTQQILLEDVAVLKATVPRNVAVLDQTNKSVFKYLFEIIRWSTVLAAIIFGADGAEKFIK